MSEKVIVRGPGEGRTLLVGGGDYVTYKASTTDTDGAYFCFEVSTTPGFGPPPLHTHAYRELFYVLEGSYEFTLQHDDQLETIVGSAGTSDRDPAKRRAHVQEHDRQPGAAAVRPPARGARVLLRGVRGPRQPCRRDTERARAAGHRGDGRRT